MGSDAASGSILLDFSSIVEQSADVAENCLMGENPPQMWCQKCCESGSMVRVREKHRRERTEFFLSAILPVPKPLVRAIHILSSKWKCRNASVE